MAISLTRTAKRRRRHRERIRGTDRRVHRRRYQSALNGITVSLRYDERRHKIGSSRIGERNGITRRYQPDQGADSARIGRSVDFEADSAGAAVDQNDLSVGISQVRISRAARAYGTGWAAAPNVNHIAGHRGIDEGETESRSVGVRS